MSSADRFVIPYGSGRGIPLILPSLFVLWDVAVVLLFLASGESSAELRSSCATHP
jgi:hypothetical protein